MAEAKKTKAKAVVTGKVKGSVKGEEIEVTLLNGELPESLINKVSLVKKPETKK